MMQNLPILNTQNAAPKTNAQGTRSNTVDQADEGGSFQQKLMHQIHQKNKGASHAQNQPANKNTAAESKAIAEKDTPSNDFISRKIKGLAGKSGSAEIKDASQADTDKSGQVATGEGTKTAATEDIAGIVDSALSPISLNVLAQVQHASKDVSASALNNSQSDLAGKPALAGEEGTLPATALVDSIESAQTGADNTGLDKAGLEKSALEKIGLNKLAVAAGNQRAESEDFASAMADSLNKATAAKEPVANMMQSQPVTAGQTAAANLANNSLIMASPGKEGWNQAIGQRVMWMVGAAQQSATLTLNPPEMGPLQIVINVHNDQADTTFFSDRQEVRQALQDGMDNLREMMKEAGINLGQTNINQRDKSAPDFMQQQQTSMQNSTNSVESVKESSVSDAPVRAGLGLVDTFA